MYHPPDYRQQDMIKNLSRPIVILNQVSKVYPRGNGTVTGLAKLDLTIDEGGVVALMGRSGSGKSTLLNLVGVLDRPSEGRITIDGKDIGSLSPDQESAFRNKTVGFVFQNFNLIPVMTSLENVLLPAELAVQQGLSTRSAIVSRAKGLIEAVGLEDQTHQKANRLSGGQMQRVAVARAIMNSPSLILADEPTANLDQTSAKQVLTILRNICTNEKSTAIIATHDVTVLDYCTRVIHLEDGRLVHDQLK